MHRTKFLSDQPSTPRIDPIYKHIIAVPISGGLISFISYPERPSTEYVLESLITSQSIQEVQHVLQKRIHYSAPTDTHTGCTFSLDSLNLNC
jgi:hypothetical protein